jgi:hypothetical protein
MKTSEKKTVKRDAVTTPPSCIAIVQKALAQETFKDRGFGYAEPFRGA